MSDNWVVQNLQNALDTWNKYLSEIWQLITQSPEQFKGGTIWGVIVNIHDAVRAIGLALLVLFFVVGVMRTCGSFAEVKKPEHALKLFIRFAIAKGVVTYGLELMVALFNIVQGLVSTIMNAAGFGTAQQTVLPQEIVTAVESCGFFREHPPLGGHAHRRAVYHGSQLHYDNDRLRAFFQIISLYGLYAPLPTSAARRLRRGAGRRSIGNPVCVCVCKSNVVVLVFFLSLCVPRPPCPPNAAAVTQVWSYIGELVFNMLVLVGAVKMADRVVREMMGL